MLIIKTQLMVFNRFIQSTTRIFLFCLSAACYAQLYRPLPDSNAVWIAENFSSGSMYFELSLSPNLNDTVINSVTYRKVFERAGNLTLNYTYLGAFRNDYNGRTYFIPRNQQPVKEYLSHDFTLNPGDTARDIAIHTNMYSFLGAFDFRVNSINYKPCGPYSLKCLYLKPIEYVPQYFGGTLVWVEGIGSLNFGILNNVSCSHMVWTGLHCMHFSDTTFFYSSHPNCWGFQFINFSYIPGTCPFPYPTVNVPVIDVGNVSVYPNPFIDHVVIKNLPAGRVETSIYNVIGGRVFHEQFETMDNNDLTINCTLSPGIYFMIINKNNDVLWKQKIVKK